MATVRHGVEHPAIAYRDSLSEAASKEADTDTRRRALVALDALFASLQQQAPAAAL